MKIAERASVNFILHNPQLIQKQFEELRVRAVLMLIRKILNEKS